MDAQATTTTFNPKDHWFGGAHVIVLTEEQIAKVVTNKWINLLAVTIGILTVISSWNLISLNPNDYFRIASYNWGLVILIGLFVSYAFAIVFAIKENAMDFGALFLLAFSKDVDPEIRQRLRYKAAFDVSQTLISFAPGFFMPHLFGMWSMVFGLGAFVIGEWIEYKYFGLNFARYQKSIRKLNNDLMAIALVFGALQGVFAFMAISKYNAWFISVTIRESQRENVDLYFEPIPIDSSQVNWQVDDVDLETYGIKGLAASPEKELYYYIKFTAIGRFYLPEKKIWVRELRMILITDFKIATDLRAVQILNEKKYELISGEIMNIRSSTEDIGSFARILMYKRFGNSTEIESVRRNTDIFN